MKEQDYQKKLINWLECRGHYAVKIVSAGKKGVPDIIACVNGFFLGIEVKTPDTATNTSKLQDYNLKKIMEAKGEAVVAVEIKDVEPEPEPKAKPKRKAPARKRKAVNRG